MWKVRYKDNTQKGSPIINDKVTDSQLDNLFFVDAGGIIDMLDWEEIGMIYSWTRYGGYEVSSKGDKRFSAFYAKLRDGRTIEEAYQLDIKGYRLQGIKNPLDCKGKPPILTYEGDELYQAYLNLWRIWADENPGLVLVLMRAARGKEGVLSDMFATSPINQAHALADVLNESEEETMSITLKTEHRGVDFKKSYPKIAFTAHRPDKLGGYENRNNTIRTTIKTKLREVCDWFFVHGTSEFMEGMAQGGDQDAGDVVLDLIDAFIQENKQNGVEPEAILRHTPLLRAAIPYPGQETRWSKEAQDYYHAQLKRIADQFLLHNFGQITGTLIHSVHQEKPKSKWEAVKWLQERNEYMVDWCDLLIAVWDGTDGGTKNCIDYALEVGKPILVLKIIR